MVVDRVVEVLRSIILRNGEDTVTAAAEHLGVGRPALSNVLNGKSELSPEMSARIDTVYECYTGHLLQAQLDADVRNAKIEISKLNLKSRFTGAITKCDAEEN